MVDETRDYLKEAKNRVNPNSFGCNPNLASASALIALVDRLDALVGELRAQRQGAQKPGYFDYGAGSFDMGDVVVWQELSDPRRFVIEFPGRKVIVLQEDTDITAFKLAWAKYAKS
jgi:hypothetical protein